MKSTMTKFNGHKNWNHWNVSLWINNDEGLYYMARAALNDKRNSTKLAASKIVMEALGYMGISKTPDGSPYSVSSILAAMRGM